MPNSSLGPRRSRIWIRFSLFSLLALITLSSVLIAYVTWRRESGSDMLVQTLQASGVSLVGEKTQPASQLSQFLGDGHPEVVVEVAFDSVKSNLAEVVVDRRLSQLVGKNRRTNQIARLSFRNAIIEEDAVCFFANWSNLKYLEIRDTRFPKSWNHELAKLSRLECVIVSGGSCNQDPKTFRDCKSLRNLKLANRGIDSTQLSELKKTLPAVDIELLASFDEPFEFGADRGALSFHDPVAYASMKGSLDRLHKALASLEPPAKNRFSPPATEAQIANYEHQLGMPLHPSVRALFEIHNGQPSRVDELVTFEKLLSLSESLGNMDIERDASFEEIEIGFNFDPEFDWMNNPCLVGIGSSEADVTYVNNVTGRVYYSNEGLYYTFPKLENYFDAITEELQAGNFETGDGNVCLSGHMIEISERWRDKSDPSKPQE